MTDSSRPGAKERWKLMAKKAPGKGRKRITKKLTDKGVAKSQKAEGTDMPPPPRPLVPDPSTWQPQDNNGGRIAREHAAQRRRFVAATQSGAIEPLLPLRAAPERTVALLPGAGGVIADTVQTSPVKSRRAVGRSVRTNRIAIVLSVASLMVLIDDKLATLRDERPNARDAQAVRDEAIAHYENLKQDLEALRDVASHKRGKAKDHTVDKVANKFVQHVQNWWEKDHEQICGKAYNAAVFISCLSVCSLVGCGGATAVVVSGAIAGGKTVVDALKALPKRLR
jgi:hypothetical protein